jgi:hypothetical protein
MHSDADKALLAHVSPRPFLYTSIGVLIQHVLFFRISGSLPLTSAQFRFAQSTVRTLKKLTTVDPIAQKTIATHHQISFGSETLCHVSVDPIISRS